MRIIYNYPNNNWPVWFSWTKGKIDKSYDIDGKEFTMQIHGGLFFWLPFEITKRCWFECYIGFRPSCPWPIGQGNEGLFASIAQWLKKKGYGNLGFALRFKEIK